MKHADEITETVEVTEDVDEEQQIQDEVLIHLNTYLNHPLTLL